MAATANVSGSISVLSERLGGQRKVNGGDTKGDGGSNGGDSKWQLR